MSFSLLRFGLLLWMTKEPNTSIFGRHNYTLPNIEHQGPDEMGNIRVFVAFQNYVLSKTLTMSESTIYASQNFLFFFLSFNICG